MSRLQDVILRGLAASKPLATEVAPGTLYFSTDTSITERCSDSGLVWENYASAGPVPPPDAASPTTFLVSGGQVTWESAYIFRISAAQYYIDAVFYSSLETTVTLAAADATNNRIDVIALNTSGAGVNITGTAAANPSEPTTDPAQYLKLTLVLVVAATVTPPTASNLLAYAENVGTPIEFAWTSTHGSINVNSVNNPQTGVKDIEGTAVAAGAYAKGIALASFNPNNYDSVLMFIRSKATWNSSRGLLVTLRLAGVLIGTSVQIRRSGTFGFNSATLGAYQQVSIPIINFVVPLGTLIDEIRIEDFGGSIGFYIDNIAFQISGTGGNSGNYLTQFTADALYSPLIHASRHSLGGADPVTLTNLAGFPGVTTTFLRGDASFAVPVQSPGTIGCMFDGGGSALLATITRYVRVPYPHTITMVTMLGDPAVSGSAVVDVWRDTYANYPPTVADTITAAAKPTITTAIKSENSTLTGWSLTGAADTIYAFHLESVSLFTYLNIQLKVTKT